MATAMVVTSLYAPQNVGAAAKNAVVLKGSTKTVKSKSIYLAGKTVDFDAMIKGKKVKDSAGKWTTSNKKVATVDKNGVVKVTGAGTATIKFTDKKSKKAVSVKIYGRVRASKVMVSPAAVTVKEGESVDVNATYELSEKVQAANGKATTYKLFAESSDENVATVSVDGNNKIMVKGVAKSATLATIKVYAAQVDTLAKAKEVKIKTTAEFTVKVNGTLEAKQTGSNLVTVTGTDLTNVKADYVLKDYNGATFNIKDNIKLNETKTEAILERDTTVLPAGKCTLVFKNGDPVSFEAMKPIVKEIVISPTNTAVMVTSLSALAYYKVYNQFGEDVTKGPLASRIKISGSDNARMKQKGVIEFNSTTGYQLNLSKLSVAVVDLETGVNSTAILTVGDEAKLWTATYEGLWNMTTRKKVESITERDKLVDYALLFKAKDQYENVYKEEPYGKDGKKNPQLNVVLLSTTALTTGKVKLVLMGEDYYYAYPLKSSTTDKNNKELATAARADEVTVQAIVTNNGKILKEKFNVVASTRIDKLTVTAGSSGVYENQENWLDYTAYDVDGKEVKDWKSFKELNEELKKNNNGRVEFVRKADGKIGLKYDLKNKRIGATKDAPAQQVLTFVTKTNKFYSANLVVRETRVPTTILGFADDQFKGVVAGRDYKVPANKIRFQDQYGNDMSAGEIVGLKGSDGYAGIKYFVEVEASNPLNAKTGVLREMFKIKPENGGAAVAQNDKTVPMKQSYEITSAGKTIVDLESYKDDQGNGTELETGTVNLKLTLKKGDYDAASAKPAQEGDEGRKIDIYSVAINDMSSFGIADPGLRAAYNLDDATVRNSSGYLETVHGLSAEGRVPTVFGYYAGEKIGLESGKSDKMPVSPDFSIYNPATPVNGVSFINQDGHEHFGVPAIRDTKDVVKRESEFRVYIHNDNATEVSRKFQYSNEARKATRGEENTTTMKLGTDILKLSEAGEATTKYLEKELGIRIFDQYGDRVDLKDAYLSFDDFDDQDVTVSNNGSNKASLKLGSGNAQVVMRLTFKNSNFIYERVINLVK